MSILRFSRFYYANDVAFVSEQEKITYGELYLLAIRLTKVLRTEHGINEGMRVGVLCRNHTISALLFIELTNPVGS